MGDETPSIELAWRWLVSVVPPDWRPFLGLAGVFAILGWLGMQFLTALLNLWHAWDNTTKRRERAKEPPAPKSEISAEPRQKIWHKPANSSTRPLRPSEGGLPIVTLANMKGGVGKTTVAANLAASLDAAGERVLLIDFDYQGSLSQTALAAANVSKIGSVVDDLIVGNKSMGAILQDSQSLQPALPNSRILTCYYEFSDTETQSMVDWLDQLKAGQSEPDARFRLAQLLSDPVLKADFDIVLIDAPPRFSTGAINAFCASSHILIPTVLDQMSAEAVVYFSRDLTAMRGLFPKLKLVGVVPTMIFQGTGYTERERAIIHYLNQSLRPFWGTKQSVIEEAPIPRRNAIGDIAGSGIGYFDAGNNRNTVEVRAIFDRLRDTIRPQLRE
jgi:chromosome partitioning protein